MSYLTLSHSHSHMPTSSLSLPEQVVEYVPYLHPPLWSEHRLHNLPISSRPGPHPPLWSEQVVESAPSRAPPLCHASRSPHRAPPARPVLAVAESSSLVTCRGTSGSPTTPPLRATARHLHGPLARRPSLLLANHRYLSPLFILAPLLHASTTVLCRGAAQRRQSSPDPHMAAH
jgi:hypothetical protein